MSLCNKDNWNEFTRLKKLIDAKPNDIKELKRELSENYFQQRLNSLSDLKMHLSNDFEDNFFNRQTMRFFGTRKVKFSKKYLTVLCENTHSNAVYDVIFENGYLSLIHASREN